MARDCVSGAAPGARLAFDPRCRRPPRVANRHLVSDPCRQDGGELSRAFLSDASASEGVYIECLMVEQAAKG